MKKLYAALLIALFGVMGAGFLQPPAAYALSESSTTQACDALKDINPEDEGCGAADGTVNAVIRVVINILSIIAGLIAVIMIIVSGLKYITSQGDSNQISSSKKSLIYAILGLVVVAFAQIIVKFVVAKTS